MHWYKLTDIRRSVTLTRNTALVLFYYCYCITLLCEQVKVTRCFIIYAIAKFKNYKATSDKGTLKLFYKLETKFWKIKYQLNFNKNLKLKLPIWPFVIKLKFTNMSPSNFFLKKIYLHNCLFRRRPNWRTCTWMTFSRSRTSRPSSGIGRRWPRAWTRGWWLARPTPHHKSWPEDQRKVCTNQCD